MEKFGFSPLFAYAVKTILGKKPNQSVSLKMLKSYYINFWDKQTIAMLLVGIHSKRK